MFFSVINKNLNWEILTKNLVTFKRSDEIKMKISILWEFTYLGEVHKKPIYRGELPERQGACTVCRFKGEGLGKKAGGGVFEEVDTPMHTMMLRGIKQWDH